MATVEAIQVELVGKGVILWPHVNAPAMITDEKLHRMIENKDVRIFEKANTLGTIYRYEYHAQSKTWYFREKISGKPNNIQEESPRSLR